MKSRRFLLWVGILLIAGLGWFVWENRVFLYYGISFSNVANMESREQDKKANDPCWYITLEGFHAASDEMKNKRQERNVIENFGYPTDMPLSEVLKVFNEEMKCSPRFREYPPLTEDEVIAAIVVGVNENKRGSTFHTERDAFWKIATQRIMPKGTVLRVHSGGNVQGSPLSPYKTINAKGIEIFLLLGADKNGRSGLAAPSTPEEILTIRKTFSGIEVTN